MEKIKEFAVEMWQLRCHVGWSAFVALAFYVIIAGSISNAWAIGLSIASGALLIGLAEAVYATCVGSKIGVKQITAEAAGAVIALITMIVGLIV